MQTPTIRFLLFVLIVIPSAVLAQNVGIGTDNPQEKLNVVSEASTSSTITTFTFTKSGCSTTTGDVITTGDNVNYDAFGDFCGGTGFDLGLSFTFNAPSAGTLTFDVTLSYLNYDAGNCADCKANANISAPNFTFDLNGADQIGAITWAYNSPTLLCPTCAPSSGGVCNINATASVSFPVSAGANTIDISRITLWPVDCPASEFSIDLQNVLFSTGGAPPAQDIARLEGGGNVAIGDIGFSNDNSYKLYIDGDAGATGGFSTASDARFKQEIIPVKDALKKVKALRGVSYSMRHDEFPNRSFRSGRQYGFIAQEIRTVLPETVSTGSSGYLSVQYDQIIPVMAEAMKILSDKVDALEAQNAQLKAKLDTRNQQQDARLKHLETILGERAER